MKNSTAYSNSINLINNEEFQIKVSAIPKERMADIDYKETLYDVNKEIDMLSPHTDEIDCVAAAASGVLCGMLDILWVGDFNLERGRKKAEEGVQKFVKKFAKLNGCKSDDLSDSVKFLENKFPMASDANTPQFGGGKMHHMRDFGHHPTFLGLACSIVTQFTEWTFGTDTSGDFICEQLANLSNIGKNVPEKISFGVLNWFGHLISDMAGSSASAFPTGGAGIPGPILSLAKEFSSLPIFKNANSEKRDISVTIQKMYNGTYFKQDGTNVKMDLRGELGVLEEIGRQAIPVAANDIIVRIFYFIRRLAIELKKNKISKFDDLKKINWENIKPWGNPTIDRMLTIATGVFTTVDITDAAIRKEYLIRINYVGIGRFAFAIGKEIAYYLQTRDLKKLKEMYEKIDLFVVDYKDKEQIDDLSELFGLKGFGLDAERTKILFSIERLKTIYDIKNCRISALEEKVTKAKKDWLKSWMSYIEKGFPSFVNDEKQQMEWFDTKEIYKKMDSFKGEQMSIKLLLLEAMIFEPYFVLEVKEDENGKLKPSNKYYILETPFAGFDESDADFYLENSFSNKYCRENFIYDMRKSYNSAMRQLTSSFKKVLVGVGIVTGAAALVAVSAGAFAGLIAPLLVGSQFIGLSGAALTSASLAYIGGGAIAAGGFGMAGGTAVIVGGGAVLGAGAGAGFGKLVTNNFVMSKNSTIMDSAKLLVTIKEIILQSNRNIALSKEILSKYIDRVGELDKKISTIEHKIKFLKDDEKKELELNLKEAKDTKKVMDIAIEEMKKINEEYKKKNK